MVLVPCWNPAWVNSICSPPHHSQVGWALEHRRNKDAVLTRVEKRLELWTHHNVSYQEDMQILRYSNFQKYGEGQFPVAVLHSSRQRH
jgi:isopentenyldiphosphate isomerase